MRIQYLGGLLAAALAGSPAAAQEPAAGLTLLCTGTDAVAVAIAPGALGGRSHYGGYHGAVISGVAQGRAAAQLGVTVEGAKVRVRPPKSSVPLFAKGSEDGWYELADVAVDRLSIKGRLKLNRLDRVRLDVDRRTGVATFGEFSGVCEAISSNPDATKF